MGKLLGWLGSKTVIAAILYAASQIVTDHSPASIATNISILIGVIGARDAVRKVQEASAQSAQQYAPKQTAGPTNDMASISPRRVPPAPRSR